MSADLSPKPYRIEWRAILTTTWLLVKEADSHDEALTIAREHVGEFGGYTRVIVQHVIERYEHAGRSA